VAALLLIAAGMLDHVKILGSPLRTAGARFWFYLAAPGVGELTGRAGECWRLLAVVFVSVTAGVGRLAPIWWTACQGGLSRREQLSHAKRWRAADVSGGVRMSTPGFFTMCLYGRPAAWKRRMEPGRHFVFPKR
jgi:hypothetical protein